MATHDYVIANGTGAAVRSDLNNALAAIVSNNSSSSEPGTTYAYQWWADTNANVLKIRNSANDAWITLRELDGTMLIEDGSASTPGLAFASDLDTGLFRSADNRLNFATGGTERLELGSSEAVFNDPSDDYDFRVESNNSTHMLFVDAGNDRIGIKESSPSTDVEISRTGNNPHGLSLTCTDSTNSPRLFFESTSTNDAPVLFSNDGNLVFHIGGTPGSSSGTERARIDSSGRLLVGTSSTRSNFFNDAGNYTPLLQVETTDSSNRFASLIYNTNDSNQAHFIIAKSRGSTNGSHTVVQDDDNLGAISFMGADGSELVEAARISCEVDSTPDANAMPGRLTFHTTARGSSSPTERLRIDARGILGVGATPSAWGGSRKAIQFDSAGAAYICNDSTMGIASNFYFDGSANKYLTTAAAAAIYVQNGNIHFDIAPSGTAGNSASFNTRARIDNDGLKFNGDTAAANALDDYEEGVWTPSFTGATLTTAEGTYTKIGRQVLVRFNVANLDQSLGAADRSINGLPFTAANINQNGVAYIGDTSGVTYTSGYGNIYARINAQGNGLQLLQKKDDGSTHTTAPTLGTGLILRGYAWFTV